MLELYREGWSSTMLGRKYGCDHTSILSQVHKAGIKPVKRKRIFILPIVPKSKTPGKYDHLLYEDVNPGKTYREYKEIAARKRDPITRNSPTQ